MKRFSKKDLLRMDLVIQECDPTLATLLKISGEIKLLDDEILNLYCSSTKVSQARVNKLVSKLETVVDLLKQIPDNGSTQS
jgi:hypothetical protein